jgi:PadR family transcriptional regulator, regulatory protein PadR
MVRQPEGRGFEPGRGEGKPGEGKPDLSPVRMTITTQVVLRVLLEDVYGKHYGFDISKRARVPSGSLYPILDRLERAGWIVGEWEQIDPQTAKRPRRRYYRLTGEGAMAARASIHDTISRIVPPAWGTQPGGAF